MTTVKAKFTCSSVIANAYGNSTTAHFHAVYGSNGENADYAKATPCGNISIVIDNDVPASKFFEQGTDYYLTFEAVK